MGRPQQPELARSENTDLQPDHAETRVEAHGHRAPASEGDPAGPVPEGNRPRRPSGDDADQPPKNAMAARLGILPDRRVPRFILRAVATPFRWVAKAADAAAERLERIERRAATEDD